VRRPRAAAPKDATTRKFVVVAGHMLAAARRHALLQFTATSTLRHALSTVSAGPAAAPLLPPPTPDGRLTVCLDIDECLLHAEVTDADLEVKGCADQSHQAQARADERKDVDADFEFELPYLVAPVRVFKRPGLDDFLLEAGRVAELVLYTSAAEGYASEIVKRLDPTGGTFAGILTRRHCRKLQVGSYAKDLEGLGRSLERTVLVDDSTTPFMMQPDNGLPIASNPSPNPYPDLTLTPTPTLALTRPPHHGLLRRPRRPRLDACSYVEDKVAQACFGQRARRRPLSAPHHASGCPELRPASAHPPILSRADLALARPHRP
jgi:Dullard-like phosphatase family protein